MPAKYSIKKYKDNGIYHAYNRGINKDVIFRDARDYKYFLHLMKLYLVEPKDDEVKMSRGDSLIQRGRFKGRVNVLAYALMPNHLHLLLKQTSENDMSEFMRSLLTNYSIYFNKRYKRLGPLYQGVFKAILVEDDDYLLHLSRYIHLNPRCIGCHPMSRKEYTSYEDYLGLRMTEWVANGLILDYLNADQNTLNGSKNYKDFVEALAFDSGDYLGKYSID